MRHRQHSASEIAHHIGQIGVTARRQHSGNLLLGHATAQAKERISGAARWLGKDRPRWWVCGHQLTDDLSESIHFVRKAFHVVVEFVAVAFGPFVAAFRPDAMPGQASAENDNVPSQNYSTATEERRIMRVVSRFQSPCPAAADMTAIIVWAASSAVVLVVSIVIAGIGIASIHAARSPRSSRRRSSDRILPNADRLASTSPTFRFFCRYREGDKDHLATGSLHHRLNTCREVSRNGRFGREGEVRERLC